MKTTLVWSIIRSYNLAFVIKRRTKNINRHTVKIVPVIMTKLTIKQCTKNINRRTVKIVPVIMTKLTIKQHTLYH